MISLSAKKFILSVGDSPDDQHHKDSCVLISYPKGVINKNTAIFVSPLGEVLIVWREDLIS